MKQFFRDFAPVIVVNIVILAMLAIGFHIYISTPDVYFSNETKVCVKVVPADAGDCKRLPEKYNLVWVK